MKGASPKNITAKIDYQTKHQQKELWNKADASNVPPGSAIRVKVESGEFEYLEVNLVEDYNRKVDSQYTYSAGKGYEIIIATSTLSSTNSLLIIKSRGEGKISITYETPVVAEQQLSTSMYIGLAIGFAIGLAVLVVLGIIIKRKM